MELVPILSTIILVGTIATFILAVAAYILYKIRERRSRREYATEDTRREEPHVLVQPAGRPVLEARQYADPRERYAAPRERYADPREQYADPRERYADPRAESRRQEPETLRPDPARIHVPQESERPTVGHESLFWEYTEDGFVPVRTDRGQSTSSGDDRSVDRDRAAWT